MADHQPHEALRFSQDQYYLKSRGAEKPGIKIQEEAPESRKVPVAQGADSYWFLEEGFCRSYYVKNDVEHTVWIEAPGELICEIKSLRLQIPTEYCIQVMEPITYYTINARELDRLVSESAELQAFMLQLWETRFIIAMDGLRAFQTLSARERYEYLLKNFPNMEKLSLYQLANILGITQSSLSRIRRLK